MLGSCLTILLWSSGDNNKALSKTVLDRKFCHYFSVTKEFCMMD